MSLLDKLISVERTIGIYNKTDKSELGDAINELNIDHIPLDSLKEIVTPKEDDPLLYGVYILDSLQIDKLNELIIEKIIKDFELYDYYLLCLGIYDWDKK